MGPVGPQGPGGAQGPAGAPGITVTSGKSCSVVNGGWLFSYQSVWYSTGDRQVWCSISGNATESSAGRMFKAGTNGANNGGCAVTMDADGNPTGGWWAFTDENGLRAQYTDSGSSANGSVVTFAAGDCQTW